MGALTADFSLPESVADLVATVAIASVSDPFAPWLWPPPIKRRPAVVLRTAPGRYRITGSPTTLTMHPADLSELLVGVIEPDREESLLALV